jgi:hypothetical protein
MATIQSSVERVRNSPNSLASGKRKVVARTVWPSAMRWSQSRNGS